MRKQKLSKVLAMLLAMMMLFTSTACNNREKPIEEEEVEQEEQTEVETEEEKEQEEPEKEEEPEVVIDDLPVEETMPLFTVDDTPETNDAGRFSDLKFGINYSIADDVDEDEEPRRGRRRK